MPIRLYKLVDYYKLSEDKYKLNKQREVSKQILVCCSSRLQSLPEMKLSPFNCFWLASLLLRLGRKRLFEALLLNQNWDHKFWPLRFFLASPTPPPTWCKYWPLCLPRYLWIAFRCSKPFWICYFSFYLCTCQKLTWIFLFSSCPFHKKCNFHLLPKLGQAACEGSVKCFFSPVHPYLFQYVYILSL